MTHSPISLDAYRAAVAIRDLTDPSAGPHAIQLVVDDLIEALTRAWGVPAVLHRGNPVVPIEDNYERLGYTADAAARDSRYTRYVSGRLLLRSQTSAMIPSLLDRLGPSPEDVLLACPGMVYRRDSIDRLHTGEPHQLDLWRIRTGMPLTTDDLLGMIDAVVQAALPGWAHRVVPADHPYTTDGLQIDVARPGGGGWVEVGECGLAHPDVIAGGGSDPARTTGLAMGLGLDRLVMLRKGMDDIRLLRGADPRIVRQLADLEPWVAVSSMPPARRDLSIAVHHAITAEDLGDRVRSALGDDAAAVEEVTVLSETPYADLPESAIRRMGLAPDQKNVLVRVVIRALDRTLTAREANELRNAIYAAVHEGGVSEWAS